MVSLNQGFFPLLFYSTENMDTVQLIVFETLVLNICIKIITVVNAHCYFYDDLLHGVFQQHHYLFSIRTSLFEYLWTGTARVALNYVQTRVNSEFTEA